MRNFLRKWLGIETLSDQLIITNGVVIAHDDYLESREPCRACGHHRYQKKVPQRYDEIERARARKRKAS